jgi:hypothetical protein
VAALADHFGRSGMRDGLVFLTLVTAGIASLGIGIGLGHAKQDQKAPPSDFKPVILREDPKPGADLYGDPLPPGAVARLGTTRFRMGMWPKQLTPSPDGKLLVTAGHNNGEAEYLTVWDAATGRGVRRVELPGAFVQAVHWLPGGRGFAVVKVTKTDYVPWEFTNPEAAPPATDDRELKYRIFAGSFTASAISKDSVPPEMLPGL